MRGHAILLGGANGSGKTTFARQLLPLAYPDAVFLNADEIQGEDVQFAHPVAAGRELLRRLDELATAKKSFAIETTLASRGYARRLGAFRTGGRNTWPRSTSSSSHRQTMPFGGFVAG